MLSKCLFFLLLVQLLSIQNVASTTCGNPEMPRDGQRSSPHQQTFKPGETVHYYCKANYTLSGAPKVLCMDDGTWDRKPPVCIDPCGTCDNGGLCVHKTWSNNFACVCNSGYRGGSCEISFCVKPSSVANGGFYVITQHGRADYDVGSKLLFHCNNGYRLKGGNNIMCIPPSIAKARWSSSFPTCERRMCQNPLNNQMLVNGDYSPRYASYGIGDIVSFTCDAGYELHGALTLRCQISGLWSAVSWPRCAPKLCRRPPVIPNGRVILTSDRSTAGTTIRYTCRTGSGFILFGPQSQTCVSNANGDMIWTPQRPLCITRLQFEQYCAVQDKVMTFDPTPSCVHKTALFGGPASVKRNTSIDTLTIVTGTAGGLLGFLLVIIAFVICQRRRLVRRMRLATSRRARTSEDERMLIYCSNDFHFFLPSYDEAMRSRPAEPPPFEAVVEENGQVQNTEGATTAAIESSGESDSDVESTYEAIENVTNTSSDNAESHTRSDDVVRTAIEAEETELNEDIRVRERVSRSSSSDENHPLI